MSTTPQFDFNDLEIVQQETVFNGFFKMQKVQFRHRLFNGGMSNIVTRELLLKQGAVAVIAYDVKRDTVVLVEQVRIGAYDENLKSSPWLLELIAGMVEEGETAESVAERESFEEAGIKIENLTHALSVWDSPGGMKERIDIFVGYTDSEKAGGIHGLAEENEDIKVHTVARETAYQWLCDGKIDNAIAVIGLQWLQLNYQTLQKKWLTD